MKQRIKSSSNKIKEDLFTSRVLNKVIRTKADDVLSHGKHMKNKAVRKSR